MHRLTLNSTYKELERGDLLLCGGYRYTTQYCVFVSFSKTRKTMNLLPLSLGLDNKYTAEVFAQNGLEHNHFMWKKAGILALWDTPFCKESIIIKGHSIQTFIPFPPDMLPDFLRKEYDFICKELGV